MSSVGTRFPNELVRWNFRADSQFNFYIYIYGAYSYSCTSCCSPFICPGNMVLLANPGTLLWSGAHCSTWNLFFTSIVYIQCAYFHLEPLLLSFCQSKEYGSTCNCCHTLVSTELAIPLSSPLVALGQWFHSFPQQDSLVDPGPTVLLPHSLYPPGSS